MTFAREKRWLLGWLALLAPLPLPFNDLLEWTVVAAYWIVVLAFLRRATREDVEWLPNWAANVLGLLYLPFLWFDLRSLWRGQLVKPLVHLILFTLAVKLFALRRERDKWHALFGAFFLFLAAMATSVHPAILVYMTVFLVVAVLTLTRFAYFHVLAAFGHRERDPARLPLRGFIAGAVVSTLIVAIPLFLFLPRVRTPYILGRGAGTGTIIHGTGFSDEMTLDGIGSIRGDRTVALRLAYDGGTPPNHERRIKIITYDRFAGTYWKRSEKLENGPPFSGGFFRLAPMAAMPPKYWMTIWRQRLDSAGLPLPVEAVAIEAPVWRLESDRGGGVFFTVPPMEVTQYRAGMGDEPLLRGLPPSGPDDPTLDTTGITERMRTLAKTAVDQGGKSSPAASVESYLTSNYGYTLDLTAPRTDNPIDDFLFNSKQGHCEYFASAMVLLLRSQGIPARLVTGFLGAEYNPIEGYFIVRQNNAHAWVEAWMGASVGWRQFDPTPVVGRPASEPMSVALVLQQAWDFVQFRWDRYVLTYGFYDQLQAIGRLRQAWNQLWTLFAHKKAVPTPVPEGIVAPQTSAPLADPPAGPWQTWGAALVMLILIGGALALLRWRRPPLTATRAYAQMRRRFERRGLTAGEAVAALEIRRRAVRQFPELRRETERVIELYLRESFGAVPVSAAERAELAAALDDIRRGLRKNGRKAA
ncbi:MAG: DUF3488 and transglutaminase-like domain-containing protein [Acidobacteriota bacterium]